MSLPLAALATLSAAPATADPSVDLKAIANDYGAHALSRDPVSQAAFGGPPTRLPSQSLGDLRQEARFDAALLARLRRINQSRLTTEERLTAGTLGWLLRDGEDAPRDYDFTFPAPYVLAEFSYLAPAFDGNRLVTSADRAAYLGLLGSVGDRMAAMRARLADQRRRGVLMPKRQVPRGIAALTGLKAQIAGWGTRSEAQLSSIPAEARSGFVAAARDRASTASGGVDALIAALGPDYVAAAPDRIGLAQYPGGRDYYRVLVRRTATFNTTPEELRDLGRRLLDENNRELETLARRLQVPGGRAGLRAYANSPGFIARTPEEVEAKYRSCLAGIAPKLPVYFSPLPKEPYRVRRLGGPGEAGMTFGYYDQPSPVRPIGEYRYNGFHLESRSTISACALIFHELVPGHHLQIALQLENASLPSFRRAGASYFAFSEGWAEYASNLAREMGALNDSNDRLGRLMLNSMIYARLVIDVGLNYGDWTFEQAQAFMRDNVYLSDREIESELLRYGADIPSQALAYGAGVTTFQRLRRETSARQGAAFDIRAFHREAIGHGSLPFSVLEAQIDRALPGPAPARGQSSAGTERR